MNVLIIQGHPDSSETHYCHALARVYRNGACTSGHDLDEIAVADLDFPILRSQKEFESELLPSDICIAQEKIKWANHIVIIYPLWHGGMPALFKAFFEQTMRYGFAISNVSGNLTAKLLCGKSARILVTMGMPAFVYRWFYFAHSLLSLERNVLKMSGIKPVKHTLIGLIDTNETKRKKWLETVELLGSNAS